MDSYCICLFWYFHSLFKCQMLNHWIIWFHDFVMNDFWPWAGSLHNLFACCLWFWSLPVVRSYETQTMSCFFMTWVSLLTTLGKLNTYITHILVSELAQLISCETVLCFLHDLSVTNKDFEHVCYALPCYTLP